MRASEFPPATPRQLEVLRWMYDFTQDKGYPPTLTELCNAFGFKSRNAAWEVLNILECKDYLERDYGSSRSIRFTARAREACQKLTVLRESRCKVCNTATFAPHLPCPECKRQRAA